MNFYILLFIGAVAFFFGVSGSFLVSEYGHRLKLDDMPSARSSHLLPTPKGGGTGILVSFVFASVFSGLNPFVWISAAALSVLSFSGDFFHVSRILRLFVQILAAFFCIYFSDSGLTPAFFVFWILFIAGTANIYNFMDGINGIAAITAVCASLLVFVYNGAVCIPEKTVMFAIGMACLGFLPFNIPAAKVFMGDVGSVLTGFWFGFMVFKCSAGIIDFLAMLSFLMPFYIDSLTTIIIRILKKENIMTPHRTHVYQILANEAGFAHWKVSVVYGLLQLAGGLCFIFASKYGGLTAGSASFLLFLFLELAVFFVVRFKQGAL